ncbi:bud neck involved protein [Cladophialophora chaetospira]|uniref:Bud neck involved protein n=1 Tax=Cladophialophora chaetospira TaxID=386627 RepID=A0AA39CF81_9EURO|nr:bud neck involved protein [Cladophialophora chaetospira]
MAALVQTLPPQTTTVTMLGRPSSSGGYPSQGSHGHMRNHQQPTRYNMPQTGYRGIPSSGPIAPPYAFTSTPQLGNTNANPNARPFALNSGRSISSPKATHMTSPPSSQPTSPSVLPQIDAGNRLSLGLPSFPSGSLMGLSQPAAAAPKPSPDRYRRPIRRSEGEVGLNRAVGTSALPSGSGMAAVGSLYNHPTQSSSTPSLSSSSQQSHRSSTYGTTVQNKQPSADDLQLARPQPPELAARYRRRSFGSIETAGLNHSSDPQETASPHPNMFLASPQATQETALAAPPQRPNHHKHTPSSDSINSSRSARSSRPGSAQSPVPASSTSPLSTPKQEPRLAVPSRPGDSSIRQPSPLSRPVDITAEPKNEKHSTAPTSLPSPVMPTPQPSSAAEQLAAVSKKDAKKSKSKLRRAFSFGSAAELRKATAQHNHEKSVARDAATTSKRHSKYEDELEPEQARIAEKQEAAGLGESIYSGQGNFFTGSTDNLSISSTASSASVMLRKMGKGVKKGTRSLVGLFRPKSVVGVPAADGPVNQASLAQVSMVTVEAEREKVNVNVDPHDQPGGGTGFPKLERNSVDTKLSFDSGTRSSDTLSRRSIVGGEKERAEILAAVKKGILKRADSSQASPKTKTYDFKVPDFNLPQIPHMNDSPRSSAPSTPADETPRTGHRRTDSITIQDNNEHDDYFTSMDRFGSIDSKSTPVTTHALIRNISFSPRIQFHDTWPSGEYDRRGEIATCNRLTPMLAQQIKEELNTFKMEMEVHESSKVYTHFF